MTDPTREQMLEWIAELEKDNAVLHKSAVRANDIARRCGQYATAMGEYRDEAWKERDQLRQQVIQLEYRRSMLLGTCATVGWISSCEVRELLGVGCERAGCVEPRPHEHITLDGEVEKATGGIVTEPISVGESGCSLPHMSLPKGGKSTGQKVTVHVGDPALREVIDKIRSRDCTEDAAYDKGGTDA